MNESNEKRRIAFFLGSMGAGGAERVISILSRHFAEEGFATDIGALLRYEQFYQLDQTTRFLDFTGGNGSRWRRVPYWLRSIRSYVKQEKPDVIVSFAARINILVVLSCFGLGVKVIVSERNDPRFDTRGKLGDLLTKLLYPYAYAIVFQTKRAMDYFSARIKNKGRIIYNPVSVHVQAAQQRTPKIVTVGSLKEQKNHRLLIQAFQVILQSHPDYQLWIYGEGELREELEKLICENGLQDNVFLPGTKKDVLERIRDAEVFVMSSDYEGLSNAFLEAMMMGLTVVSTECAGADEIIEDHVNGLLVPTGDRDALAKAILYCIENPAEAKRLGENAAHTSKSFSFKTVFRQWDALVNKALTE